MSEMALLWVLGGFMTALLALAGALWKHVNECRDTRVDIATIKGAVNAIAREIGDHESGIRKRLHDMHGQLVRLENRRESER